MDEQRPHATAVEPQELLERESALATLSAALDAAPPLVVTVDDLHWADAPTLPTFVITR